MPDIFTADGLIALVTLTFMEIILGVDNIIFISIVSNKLPDSQSKKARITGISLAIGVRIIMLLMITWLIGFTKPLITLDLPEMIHSGAFELSGRDIILALGGLFLLGKSTSEIHHKMSGDTVGDKAKSVAASFASVITQIILLDVVFSFDSILTAVGLTENVTIMIIAVVISMIIMMVFAGKISGFIDKHPTLQVLALSFLILIGVMLIVEGLHVHVPKGYIYFAVFFSLAVEVVNMRVRKNKKLK